MRGVRGGAALLLVLAAFFPALAVAAGDDSAAGATPVTTAMPATAPVAARPAPPLRFDIWEFVVAGNTVLEDEAVQGVLARFLGPDRGVPDVDAARTALQEAYQARGFQTVSVSIDVQSRQAVADGVIVLRVEEGKVRQLTVTGAEYFSIERIRAEIPSLAEGVVPDFIAVERDLAALNRQADRSVVPAVSRNGNSADLNVELAVSDELPLHGMLELNNRYSNGTSELRAMALLSYDNLWQRGHGLSLMWQTSPENTQEGTVLYASYLMRFADPDFTLQFSGLNSQSDVASVGGTNVIGKGSVFGIRGSWQLAGNDGWNYGVSTGLDYKDFINKIQLGGASKDSPLRYVPATLSLNASHRDEQAAVRYGIDFMATLPSLGSDSRSLDPSDPDPRTVDASRFGATRQMRWLRGSTQHTFELEKNHQLALSSSLQFTDLPLVSNEQFSAGGMDSVRGYLEAESAGDRGVLASAEYRFAAFESYLSGQGWHRYIENGRPFLFIDAANLFLTGPMPDATQRQRFELYSAGAGVNVGFLGNLHAALVYSNPLSRGVFTDKNDGRILFRLWGTF